MYLLYSRNNKYQISVYYKVNLSNIHVNIQVVVHDLN